MSMERAAPKKTEANITVDLECLNCHQRLSAAISGEEFKELSVRWKLARPCTSCGQTTDWSFAEAIVEIEEQVDFWDWLATTGEALLPPGAAHQDERRKELRVNLQVPLRITGGGGEEEVTSENISKSGFSFRSSRVYPAGETLRVTLQPPGASTRQIKTATVVRATPAPEGKTLYGARLAA